MEGAGTRRRAGKVRSTDHRSRTEAPDLTDPSELLSESKQPTLSLSVGGEEGRSAGKPAAPTGAALGYAPVRLPAVTDGPGGANTAAHSGAGISSLSNMVNQTGAARRSDYTGRRPISCHGALTSRHLPRLAARAASEARGRGEGG